jgi:hypothetical protein
MDFSGSDPLGDELEVVAVSKSTKLYFHRFLVLVRPGERTDEYISIYLINFQKVIMHGHQSCMHKGSLFLAVLGFELMTLQAGTVLLEPCPQPTMVVLL